jgi:cysteine dioxygenase
MAAGIAAAKSQKNGSKSLDAEKISSEIIEEFRSRFKTTRCSDIISSYPDFSTEDRKRLCADIVEFTTRITADLLTKQEIDREAFSLTRFIDHLNRLPQSELTMEKVIPLMERVQIRRDEIEKCLIFSEESYARNLFYKNDRYEILVMCWDRGQLSPIHDHDQSYSVEKIYSGKILCTNYRRREPNSDAIEETDSSLAEEGSVISGRRGDIHRIANTDPNSKAVSIHFYSPPLKRMKAYSLDGREGQWMKLRYLYIYRPEVWQSLESCNL